MRTVRDGAEVHPGLDADHRPELVPDPEPLEELAPEAADDTPVPTVLDGVLVSPAAAEAEPAAAPEVAKPKSGSRRKKV